MRHIFLDFEMSQIHKDYPEERGFCRSEIVQIGAVMLDDTYREISSFQTYVKPEYNNDIDKSCQKVTGITYDMVADAPLLEPAMQDFARWCNGDWEDDYIIYAWSDSDYIQLKKELNLKDITCGEIHRVCHNWVDFQRQFGDILGLEKRISLQHAVGAMQEDFDGDAHDALWDARNTAKIFAISKNAADFKRIFEPLIELFQPAEPLTSSLGDLFPDLAKLL